MFIGSSIINHPFWGTPIFGNTNIFNNYVDPPKIVEFRPPNGMSVFVVVFSGAQKFQTQTEDSGS